LLYVYNKVFLAQQHLGRHKKDLGVTACECPPPHVWWPWQNRRQKVFHWGIRVCAGGL